MTTPSSPPSSGICLLDAVQDEHLQMSVEVDDLFGVVQRRARPIAAEYSYASSARVVDVFLGLPNRVETADESVAADGLQEHAGLAAGADVDSAAGQLLDLLVDQQSGLGVLDHEPPREDIVRPGAEMDE